MKVFVFSFSLLVSFVSLAQQDVSPRGPYNTLDGGIIDGVVIKDEVPIRSAIPYEHVRLADYVWSKRVFSRIDAREKLNHEIFFPFDRFKDEYKLPRSPEQVDGAFWTKHQERWSLWTVILRHIMLGDLTIYSPYDYTVVNNGQYRMEDGYQFKYPVNMQSRDDYFANQTYQKTINFFVSSTGQGKPETINIVDNLGGLNEEILVRDPNSTLDFQGWFDSIVQMNNPPEESELMLFSDEQRADLELRWNEAANDVNGFVVKPAALKLQSSQGIIAYNIKEDWFFDKERSILDKRIIAIAPVAKYTFEDSVTNFRGNLVAIDELGNEVFFQDGVHTPLKEESVSTVQLEMFWLYFPELRNVIVNYYTYNDKSDALWMSFDDLFWKRKFNAQIYRTSDKFDREIEDYRFGVDALREAEKIKGEIRKWEHDVWNY
ncbi:MAG: hypothetical protein HOH34_08820 [Flavobacteriales bacterium]|nr:hypothetical protein [Flavobacteriales bacterium]